MPGLESWLVFAKIMSYYAYYDGILRLLESLCKSARIAAVHKQHGSRMKNEAKYSLWHPYSDIMKGLNRETVRYALKPTELLPEFRGWTNFVLPILKAEMRKTEPTIF